MSILKHIPSAAVAAAACLLAVAAAAAQAPRELAGFTLGEPIAAYEAHIIPETALAVRYFETFQEVEIRPHEGYKSGLLGYGTCGGERRIVRIKLKYADGSKAFFEKLLERFKQRFGEPTEYTGDAFKVFISWKWSFRDQNNQRITLTLQHNRFDEDEKMGNAVKLTNQSLVDEELACYQRQEDVRRRMRQLPPLKIEAEGWDRFVPR